MKQGKTLTELAIELDRQQRTKRDYVAPANRMQAVVESDGGALVPALDMRGIGTFQLQEHAHGQLATYTEIPKAYYDRMRQDAPRLWAANVNEWVGRQDGSRMVRTLDYRVRAILSDRYRPLENYDLAQAVLPALQQVGPTLEIVSCDVTDTRLYIKAVDPARQETIERAWADKGLVRGVGHNWVDVISPAVVIQNSEVGAGALAIMISIYVKACTNLAVWEGGDMKRYHVGKRAEVSDEVYAMLTDETRAAVDQAVWLQARDVTRGAFEDAKFNQRVKKLQAATQDEIKCEVTELADRARQTFGLREAEAESMLDHLIRGGDFTRYGLHNAITRTAQDLESYDRASELEKLGGRVIELPSNQWQVLARKAA